MTGTFGKNILKEFTMEETFINVNFGSFGSPPQIVQNAFRKYQELMDKNPEKWLRYEVFSYLSEIRNLVGKFIKAEPKNLALIENASDGINAALRSFLVTPKEKVLVLDVAYPMVLNTINYLKETFQIEVIKVSLDKETLNSDEKILKLVETTIINQGPFKIACFDHISSIPSLIFPVKQLCSLFRKYGIIGVVDAAHAIGHIPLNLSDIEPDIYVSNFHKWGFAPKSAAFLYVSKEFQSKIHPNIISNKYKSSFLEEFDYTGTRNYSSILAVKDSLEFMEKKNLEEIFKYNHNLAWEAGLEISKLWGTEMLIEDKSRIGNMVNVRIPCEDKEIIEKSTQRIFNEQNCFIPFTCFNDGKFYARFSAQIFNELSDFKKAGEMLLKEIQIIKN